MGDEVTLRVAGLCVAPRPWDKEANLAGLERLAREAAEGGAQLVVTPEGFLEGYLWQDDAPQEFTEAQYRAAGEELDGPLLGRVRALAQDLGIHLALGFAERLGDQMFNSAVIFGPAGQLVARYAKAHTADDEPYNTKGQDLRVYQTAFGPWGVLICLDRQLPEAMRILALRGARLVVVPAWGMSGEINDVMMRTRAYENGVHVVFVHPRRGLVIDPGGAVVAECAGPDEQILHAEITLADFRPFSPLQYRRPELYGPILEPPS